MIFITASHWSTDPEILEMQVQRANQIYWLIYKEDILRELEKEKCANLLIGYVKD